MGEEEKLRFIYFVIHLTILYKLNPSLISRHFSHYLPVALQANRVHFKLASNQLQFTAQELIIPSELKATAATHGDTCHTIHDGRMQQAGRQAGRRAGKDTEGCCRQR